MIQIPLQKSSHISYLFHKKYNTKNILYYGHFLTLFLPTFFSFFIKFLCQRDVSWFKEIVFFEVEEIVVYFDISKKMIDDETRNISKTEDETRITSKTEEGSGILGDQEFRETDLKKRTPRSWRRSEG